MLVSLLVVSCPASTAPSALPLVHSKSVNAHETYAAGLIKLAVSYHPEKYQISSTKSRLSEMRQFEELKSGRIDIIWMGASFELEERFLPIRIPLFKGLLGHRIFMIRKGQQAKFSQMNSLDDLKNVSLGQGGAWADTAILQAAGLDVVTANNYPSLFHMLDGGRFDAFPRGIHEPWEEIERHSTLDLVVEKHLMLVYRMPLYFFVAKENISLAKDIENGLERAIKDKSFDRYFYHSPIIQTMLEKANMDERKVFYLNNPFAHPKTPIARSELWFH